MELNIYTNTFPFGNGETFLEEEVCVLSKCYNQINIFPLTAEGEKRELPENVKIFLLDNAHSSKIKPIIYFKFLLFELFVNIKYHKLNLERIRWSRSYLIQKFRVAERLKYILIKDNIKNFTHYSYWLLDWTLILSILKEDNTISSFISRGHGIDLFHDRWKLSYIPFQKLIIKKIDKLVLVSKAAKKYMEELYPEYSLKFHLSHLGTRLPSERCKIKLINHVFSLVSCSNVISLKRVLEITQILKKINFPIKWVHFGDGPQFGILKEQIETLPSNVCVELKGRVSNKSIHNFYESNYIDAFITLTTSEGGVPVSLQEAASYGIPLIATDAGGVSEIVNKETGFLLPLDYKTVDIIKIFEKLNSSSFNRESIIQYWEKYFSGEKNFRKFKANVLDKFTYHNNI
jgi:glycosyltransferase involved in cell wall biosynthesis